jgi:hypothetical protein
MAHNCLPQDRQSLISMSVRICASLSLTAYLQEDAFAGNFLSLSSTNDRIAKFPQCPSWRARAASLAGKDRRLGSEPAKAGAASAQPAPRGRWRRIRDAPACFGASETLPLGAGGGCIFAAIPNNAVCSMCFISFLSGCAAACRASVPNEPQGYGAFAGFLSPTEQISAVLLSQSNSVTSYLVRT